MSLSKTLCLVQPMKAHPHKTEKNVEWDIKNQIKQTFGEIVVFSMLISCGPVN